MTSLGNASPPAAVRATRPGWRDPRLWIGVAILAASVLLGARVLGNADQSVAVWALSQSSGAGTTVTEADLVSREVRFVQAGDVDRYLPADEPLPEDTVLTRDVGEGELLPRAALGPPASEKLVYASLVVEGAGVPQDLKPGDHVVVHGTLSADQVEKVKDASDLALAPVLLRHVLVTKVSAGGTTLAGAAGTTVTVALTPEQATAGATRLAQAAKTGQIFMFTEG